MTSSFSTVPGRVEGGGQPMQSSEQCFTLSSFPLRLEFDVWGLGFELYVFVAGCGWRHAVRSEWSFIVTITIY